MEYNGADIVALFREEGAEVFAESLEEGKRCRVWVLHSASTVA